MPEPADSAAEHSLAVVRLGRMPYAEALTLQRAAADARLRGVIPDDLLLLVEHPPVITLGRSSHAENLLSGAEERAARGVELFDVDRGGDVTFHGPGQLVGYPILDLRGHREDLHWYLRQIEEVLIRALAALDISAGRRPGLTGVWTGGRKIASIGIHARQWVTWHGFALNVTTDLAFFDLIVPCGIEQVEMTSVARELGVESARDDAVLAQRVTGAVISAFAAVFGLHVLERRREDIEAVLALETTGR